MQRTNVFRLLYRHLFLTLAIVTIVGTASIATADRTSENTPQLAAGLKQFPAADTNSDGVLTMTEAQTFLKKRRDENSSDSQSDTKLPPDFADLKYGPHERNRIDLWQAKRDDDRPTPVAVYIHGGGFLAGDKRTVNQSMIRYFLDHGISVAAINYRLTHSGPFPIPMNDSARAVQYLRYHAERYNLDKEKFACYGGSAGGCLSMWLAMHDDLADPHNTDPVLRESTRLTCAAPSAGQSSLNHHQLLDWFDVERLTEHSGGRPLFGVPKSADIDMFADEPKMIALMNQASPIFHLTKDDPPIFAIYSIPNNRVTPNTSPGNWVHHPRFGIKLKEAMDPLDIECHVQYPGGPKITKYDGAIDFMVKKLAQ